MGLQRQDAVHRPKQVQKSSFPEYLMRILKISSTQRAEAGDSQIQNQPVSYLQMENGEG